MISKESIVCWNCHGSRSGQFLREMKEIIGDCRPMLIVLLETKINGEVVDEVCKKIGKSR